MRQIQSIVIVFCLACLRLYRLVISPLLPAACRFEPTCSRYAAEALRSHGLYKGSWLTVKRLCRCYPFGTHGYDPVPAPHSHSSTCQTRTGL